MHYIYILYLTLPAFVANVLPIFATRFNLWEKLAKPVDQGKMIFNKRIFGDHKTWRGFVVGVLGAIIVVVIQFILTKFNIIEIKELELFWQFILFGFLAGLGALIGDSLESSIKRQLNIQSGKSFFPFDQIDYILGFLLFSSLLIVWSWQDLVFLLIFSILIAPVISMIGYLTHIKKNHH